MPRISSLTGPHDGWLGLPMSAYEIPGLGEQRVDTCLTEPLLVAAQSGGGRRWYTCGTRTRELRTAPHAIELLGAGYQVDTVRWDGKPAEVIAITFPAAMVNRLLHGDGPPFDLITRHEVFDDRIGHMVLALWHEASRGSPRGPLYTEGLTLALIGLLSAQHCARPASRAATGTQRFHPRERARLQEFITEEMAGQLGIERLAAQVTMSPDHFARVFKATFGQSPHAYVVEQRLEAACRALRNEPDRSIADIASESGFSSQSHFTDVFRRKVGTTPARWRNAG